MGKVTPAVGVALPVPLARRDATDGGGWRIPAIAVIVVAGLVVLVTVGRRVERLDGKLSS